MATTLASSSQPDLVELEIAAFMGPHIKRARIALVLIGVLYAVTAYFQYDDIARLRALVRGNPGEIASLINLAYYLVVGTIVVGVANIVFAAIGGKQPAFAIYGATALFGLQTLFSLYVTGILLFTSLVWWLTVICLVFAVQAVYKAQQLRKQPRSY
jgi:hypothetical protein